MQSNVSEITGKSVESESGIYYSAIHPSSFPHNTCMFDNVCRQTCMESYTLWLYKHILLICYRVLQNAKCGVKGESDWISWYWEQGGDNNATA